MVLSADDDERVDELSPSPPVAVEAPSAMGGGDALRDPADRPPRAGLGRTEQCDSEQRVDPVRRPDTLGAAAERFGGHAAAIVQARDP